MFKYFGLFVSVIVATSARVYLSVKFRYYVKFNGCVFAVNLVYCIFSSVVKIFLYRLFYCDLLWVFYFRSSYLLQLVNFLFDLSICDGLVILSLFITTTLQLVCAIVKALLHRVQASSLFVQQGLSQYGLFIGVVFQYSLCFFIKCNACYVSMQLFSVFVYFARMLFLFVSIPILNQKIVVSGASKLSRTCSFACQC